MNGLIEQLCDLTSDWNAHELVPAARQKECREIGQKLHDLGGMPLMHEAYQQAHRRNRYASVIAGYWDGIGEWQW